MAKLSRNAAMVPAGDTALPRPGPAPPAAREEAPPAARGKARCRSGQSLVEFALVVPILLFLLIGICEFGRAWMTRNILTGAAREAVRVAAVQGDAPAATARAEQVLSSAGLAGATVALADDNIPFGSYTATVRYQFPMAVVDFLPGISGASLPLVSTTTMRKEF